MTTTSKPKLNKAKMIQIYCDMNSCAKSALDYFKKARQKQTRKPVIKKKIYESHYKEVSTFINPNFEKMMDKIARINSSSAQRLRQYFDNIVSVR